MKFSISFALWIISTGFIFSGCAFKGVTRSKHIVYLEAGKYKSIDKQELNVFAPRKRSNTPYDVLIFIHGGSWNSGKKELYSFFGNRFARKGIVCVVIDYPLTPRATYHDMATATAHAVAWTKQHIQDYKGDPNAIFVSGHSAGGHLAALLTVNNTYFDSIKIQNPIKGAILIDAAGLDMFTYLKERNLPQEHSYIKTFTNNPAEWRKASPITYVDVNQPPVVMLMGERTYTSIKNANERFYREIKKVNPSATLRVIKEKKHVPMITQFFNARNPNYKEIISFMKNSDDEK